MERLFFFLLCLQSGFLAEQLERTWIAAQAPLHERDFWPAQLRPHALVEEDHPISLLIESFVLFLMVRHRAKHNYPELGDLGLGQIESFDMMWLSCLMKHKDRGIELPPCLPKSQTSRLYEGSRLAACPCEHSQKTQAGGKYIPFRITLLPFIKVVPSAIASCIP